MRSLFWFLPAVVIPLTFQIMSSGQPFSPTTVDTPDQPLPPLSLLPQTTLATSIVSADHPPTSAKKQPQEVIAQKHPLKAKPENSKNKVSTRSYTAPAIEIRVAIEPQARRASHPQLLQTLSTATGNETSYFRHLRQFKSAHIIRLSYSRIGKYLRAYGLSHLMVEQYSSISWYRGLLQLITLFIEAIRNLRRSPH